MFGFLTEHPARGSLNAVVVAPQRVLHPGLWTESHLEQTLDTCLCGFRFGLRVRFGLRFELWRDVLFNDPLDQVVVGLTHRDCE